MLMVIPNEGKVQFLAIIFSPPTIEDFRVVLYTNNYTPDDDSTAVNFVLATFAGSAPIVIDAGSWDVPAAVGDVGEITATVPPEWTHGGGAAQLVYGWMMYGEDTEICYAAQRFDAPINMTSGSSLALDPFKFKLKSFA